MPLSGLPPAKTKAMQWVAIGKTRCNQPFFSTYNRIQIRARLHAGE